MHVRYGAHGVHSRELPLKPRPAQRDLAGLVVLGVIVPTDAGGRASQIRNVAPPAARKRRVW